MYYENLNYYINNIQKLANDLENALNELLNKDNVNIEKVRQKKQQLKNVKDSLEIIRLAKVELIEIIYRLKQDIIVLHAVIDNKDIPTISVKNMLDGKD